jgi:tetratricopeptide (TPR) repeat protein
MIFASFVIFALTASALAQASAAHQLRLKGNPTPLAGTVVGADGRSVQFQTAAGTVGYPLQNVESVTMPMPAELSKAFTVVQAGDAAKALPVIQGFAQKYRGLPVDWARLASSSVGNLLITTGDLDKADAAFKEFEQLYPGAGGLLTKVGLARIAVAKKDFTSAKDSLAPIVEEALKQKNVPRENAFAYSQAFYAMGLINESEEKMQDALENYLRTVTIFYHDPSARAGAQQHADELRAKNKDIPASKQIAVP